MASLYEEELAAASGDGGGFQVYPRKSTPHLDCISTDPLDGAKALAAVCARCGEDEVWICLQCHAPHCSRYKNGCCKKHAEESGHLIAVSLSDLSVWDYGQDCYLDVYAIPKLRTPYASLHLAKFGEAPSFPGAPVLELEISVLAHRLIEADMLAPRRGRPQALQHMLDNLRVARAARRLALHRTQESEQLLPGVHDRRERQQQGLVGDGSKDELNQRPMHREKSHPVDA